MIDGRHVRRRADPFLRTASALVALVALTGCRVDVTTSIQLDRSGAGAVTVDVVADADVVERVPDLAEQLRLDDLIASGWQSDGPVGTADGGLRVTLVHPVSGPDEANQVLAEIDGEGGPYRDLVVERRLVEVEEGTSVVTTLTGSLGLDDGAGPLGDADLQALLPDVPLSALLDRPDGTASAVADVLGARLVVGLPDDEGDATPVTFDDAGATEAQVFTMPADGSVVDVAVQSTVDPDGGRRAPVVAVAALIGLVAWLGVSIAFASFVLRHHRRRRAT